MCNYSQLGGRTKTKQPPPVIHMMMSQAQSGSARGFVLLDVALTGSALSDSFYLNHSIS